MMGPPEQYEQLIRRSVHLIIPSPHMKTPQVLDDAPFRILRDLEPRIEIARENGRVDVVGYLEERDSH